MCDKVVKEDPGILWPVPDWYKTQETCDKTVEESRGLLEYSPDQYKTQEMGDNAVEEDLCLLEYVPDWLVWQEQIDLWCDDNDYYDDDVLIEWYEGYQKRKIKKAKIKEELLPIAWHSNHCDELVYVRRQEEAVEVTDSCFKIIKGCLKIVLACPWNLVLAWAQRYK